MGLLSNLIVQEKSMIETLETVRKLNLPNWCIAAGFVRNFVWDFQHNYKQRTPSSDVDVIYYDSTDLREEREKELEGILTQLESTLPWSVKNQARMHIRNQADPYESIEDAMSRWPETATAVGVRLELDNSVTIVAPFGVEDLFNLAVRRSAYFRDQDYFYKRIQEKNWLLTWPELRIVDEE